MIKRVLRTLGGVVFAIGFFLILNSVPNITGYAIFEGIIGGNIGRLIGIALLITGVLLINVSSRNKTSNLEESVKEEDPLRILKTKKFKKSLRHHNSMGDRISKAIEKIGTGKGKEHQLTTGEWAISVSKGGRIIYNKYEDKIELKAYLSNHQYDVYIARINGN